MSTTDFLATTLAERIAEQRDTLSPSELRVAEFMYANPDAPLFSSAAELGRLAGTSDATVVRAIKQLGYAGMDELREELRDALGARLTAVRRLQRSLDWAGGEPGEVLDHMLEMQAMLVEDTRAAISPTQFTHAVELLARAPHTLVYGIGPLEHIAGYLALRLSRLGQRAEASGATGFRLADDLLRLSRHDVVVLLAYAQSRHEIGVILDRAEEVGAEVILVTDTLGRALGSRVAATLNAPAIRNLMMGSFTTTLLLADALSVALAARSRRQSERQFERLEELRGRLAPQVDAPSPKRRRRQR